MDPGCEFIILAVNTMDVLRTAKQAMDDGLIAKEDFDVIKKAFLKAQQIKAGIDAGETDRKRNL